ncbi:NucA/NucB deoxyribonuclease domain-containing protein [Microbispora bryophytorum]|uniref:NucA/NucB deoxyribonuclease domain-containing protein n=1 Tax=Microbispora bryophytorum TaxID=1460882 RepID=UPI0033DA863B
MSTLRMRKITLLTLPLLLFCALMTASARDAVAHAATRAITENGCDHIRDRFPSLARQGKRKVVCVAPVTQPPARSVLSSTSAADDPPPLPAWCIDPPDDQSKSAWKTRRFAACLINYASVSVYDTTTRALLGRTMINYMHFIGMFNDSLELTDVFAIVRFYSEGELVPDDALSFRLAVSCSYGCTAGDFGPPITLPEDSPRYLTPSAPHLVNVPIDGIRTVNTTYELQLTHPGGDTEIINVFPPEKGPYPSPDIRCDRILSGAGCVIPSFIPTLDGLSDYPAVRAHIMSAQASGLPGAPGTTPLHRLADAAKVKKNRDTACPDSLPRPPGLTCDEYPMARTWEGAWTSGGAYSTAWVPDTQNSAAGGKFGALVTRDRLLDRDAFWVDPS